MDGFHKKIMLGKSQMQKSTYCRTPQPFFQPLYNEQRPKAGRNALCFPPLPFALPQSSLEGYHVLTVAAGGWNTANRFADLLEKRLPLACS